MRSLPCLRLISAATILFALLAGCGGGSSPPGGGKSPEGGGSPLTFHPVKMQGTAAVGAPIANATVTVLCGSGETMTTTTGSDGRYSVNDISSCTGPFVVTVSGIMGDTQDTLVSVNPSDPPHVAACNGPVCPASDVLITPLSTNVTPITHAMAALLASTGDPIDLARNFATEKSGISASAVADVKTMMTTALANVMTVAGVRDPAGWPLEWASSFLDPIREPIILLDPLRSQDAYQAYWTGWNRVLDNIKIEVGPAGITMTNISAAKVDDMAAIGNGRAAPGLPANAQIALNKSNFQSALATQMPASADDNGVIDFARAVFNACFAVPAAQRGAFVSPGSACANLATSDYMNDGKNGAREFDKFLTDPKMDGARFNKPEVLRFFTAQRALVKLSAVRTDGVVISWRSVAENAAATGNTWKFRGNQRPYFMFVNGVAERRMQLPRPGATPGAYTAGLNLYFDLQAGGANDTTPGTATGVSYVVVKGPGLPSGGKILRPGPTGCEESFVLAASLPPAPLPDTQPCTSCLKIASKAIDGSTTDPQAGSFGSAPDFAAAPVSDTAILSTIQPMSAYTFEVHQRNGTVLTFVERLRGRPATLQEMDSVRWNVLSDATQAAMVPGTAQSFGGGNFTVAWVPQSHTPPVLKAQAQIKTNATGTPAQDKQGVSLTANSTILTNGGAGFPAVTNGAGGYQFVRLESRTQSDIQIFSSWKY